MRPQDGFSAGPDYSDVCVPKWHPEKSVCWLLTEFVPLRGLMKKTGWWPSLSNSTKEATAKGPVRWQKLRVLVLCLAKHQDPQVRPKEMAARELQGPPQSWARVPWSRTMCWRPERSTQISPWHTSRGRLSIDVIMFELPTSGSVIWYSHVTFLIFFQHMTTMCCVREQKLWVNRSSERKERGEREEQWLSLERTHPEQWHHARRSGNSC